MEDSDKLRQLLGPQVDGLDTALQDLLNAVAYILVNDDDADDYGHVREAAKGAAETSKTPGPDVLAELLTRYWLWLRSKREGDA